MSVLGECASAVQIKCLKISAHGYRVLMKAECNHNERGGGCKCTWCENEGKGTSHPENKCSNKTASFCGKKLTPIVDSSGMLRITFPF